MLNNEQILNIKSRAKSKWDSLGFLEGLKGHVHEDIVKLYECEVARLLREEMERKEDS